MIDRMWLLLTFGPIVWMALIAAVFGWEGEEGFGLVGDETRGVSVLIPGREVGALNPPSLRPFTRSSSVPRAVNKITGRSG